MAKKQNIIEYLGMLEQDYPAFDPAKLLVLGVRVAELEFEKHAAHFAARRLEKYGVMLGAALATLQQAARDRAAVPGPEIDLAQQQAGKAARMVQNKLDLDDARDAGLMSVLDTINSAISYLKTEDPLYMIGLWRAPYLYAGGKDGEDLLTPEKQVYYPLLAPDFGEQIALLWALKKRMKI